jgi:hypothetical protein
MALALDASTPTFVTQTSSTGSASLTTASFTPPAVGHIVVQWMGNTATGATYAMPTISDTAGLSPWVNYGYATYENSGTGVVNGAVAQWVTYFVMPPAMTITVTSSAPSGLRQAAMKAYVVTGSDTAGDSVSNAVGGYGMGENDNAPAAPFTQNIASQADYAMGFIATEDWDAGTAMSNPAGYGNGGNGVIAGALTYSFIRKSTLDTLAGQDMPMTVNRSSTSANLRWLYLELCPEGTNVGTMAYTSGKGRKRNWTRRQARFTQ